MNIVIHLLCTKGVSKSCKTPIAFSKLLVSDNIIEGVVKHTNIYSDKAQSIFPKKEYKVTNDAEITALIDVLIPPGLCKSRHGK